MPTAAERVESSVSAVLTAAMTGVLSPVPAVRVRKGLLLQDGEGTLPLVTVAQDGREEFEPLCSDADPTKLWWLVRYPLAVAYDAPAAGTAGESPDLRAWRDAVWPALADPRNLAARGLPEANDVYPRGGPAFDRPALARQVDRSVIYFVVETKELRP